METDAYNMRSEFSHICNRNQGVDGIQLVLADRKRIFYDRLSSSSVNSSWIEKGCSSGDRRDAVLYDGSRE